MHVTHCALCATAIIIKFRVQSKRKRTTKSMFHQYYYYTNAAPLRCVRIPTPITHTKQIEDGKKMPVAKAHHTDATLRLFCAVTAMAAVAVVVVAIRFSVYFCISHRYKRIKTCDNDNDYHHYYDTISPYRDVSTSVLCTAQNAVEFIIFERTLKMLKLS